MDIRKDELGLPIRAGGEEPDPIERLDVVIAKAGVSPVVERADALRFEEVAADQEKETDPKDKQNDGITAGSGSRIPAVACTGRRARRRTGSSSEVLERVGLSLHRHRRLRHRKATARALGWG